VQVKALIELECAIVVLPVLSEELEEPLGGELVLILFELVV